MLRPLIYCLIFFSWCYALTWDILYIPAGENTRWTVKLKFLTIINMVLQTCYFGLCVVRAFVDFCHETPKKGPHKAHPAPPSYYPTSKLHTICDFIYSTLAFPCGFFVVITFWGIYAIDREMIFPQELDKIIPGWMNHVMHTAPVPFLVVDSLLICHRYLSRLTGILTVLGFGIIYQISIIVWYFVEDFWVYPFLNDLDNVERAVFFVGASIFITILYLIGDFFNGLVWGTASHPPKEASVKKFLPGKLRDD